MMRLQAGRSQRSNLRSKWLPALVTGAALSFFSLPASAQPIIGISSSPWVTTTIVSVAAVITVWLASLCLSALSLKMRWVSPHRHSRLTRALQVVFGGLLLAAVLMPYLAMHHPVVATGMLITAVVMMLVMGTRHRQLQSDSN